MHSFKQFGVNAAGSRSIHGAVSLNPVAIIRKNAEIVVHQTIAVKASKRRGMSLRVPSSQSLFAVVGFDAPTGVTKVQSRSFVVQALVPGRIDQTKTRAILPYHRKVKPDRGTEHSWRRTQLTALPTEC